MSAKRNFFGVLLVVISVVGLACSSGGDAVDTSDTQPIDDSVAGTDLGPLPVTVDVSVERPLYNNLKFYMEIHRPVTCQAASPCPGLVLVPPGLESGEEYFADIASELAAEVPAVVFVYNPPGRGLGSNQTGGEEDYNGKDHQGLLSEVLQRARNKQSVDEERLGVVSFGWGLSVAAGVMNANRGSAGYVGKFLVDVEGAVSRCDITVAPFTPSGNVINQDGLGPTPSRCNLCGGDCVSGTFPGYCECEPSGAVDCGLREFPRDCKYPVNPDIQQPPPAYVCAENSDPILLSGHDCTDDPWWAEREAAAVLPTLVATYLRLQFRFDHALPSALSGREAYHLVMTGPSGIYRQYNDLPPSQPLPDVQDCGSCQLDYGSSGNGFGFNIFAAYHPEYKPMNMSVLMRQVLPLYINFILGKL